MGMFEIILSGILNFVGASGGLLPTGIFCGWFDDGKID